MTSHGRRRTNSARWGAAWVILLASGCVTQKGDPGGAGGGFGGSGGAAGASAGGGGSWASEEAGDAGGLVDEAGTGSSIACVAKTAVAAMGLGWNLGNSLDSVSNQPDATAETGWGNPMVAADLFKLVASSGFGVVRIPVTWIGHFGAAPDYTISSTFIARVEEVVNYALDQGFYVIINLHHDGGDNVAGKWINLVDSSGNVTAANNAQVKTQFQRIWAQIADRFKNYDEHLILESMNEVGVPKVKPVQAYYDQINALNQAFVDTVRSSGGNNLGRCLVVPGYYTNIDYTVAGFKTPKDTSPGRLILSDHYYDPWTFAGSGTTHTWGAGNPGVDKSGQEGWVQGQVAKLKANYIDQGLPVIWGEYGAVNQTGYENYRRYYMEYVTKVAHDEGIVPVVWDNNNWSGSGNDAFGFINRTSNAIQYPTIVDAMVRAVTSTYSVTDVAKP